MSKNNILVGQLEYPVRVGYSKVFSVKRSVFVLPLCLYKNVDGELYAEAKISASMKDGVSLYDIMRYSTERFGEKKYDLIFCELMVEQQIFAKRKTKKKIYLKQCSSIKFVNNIFVLTFPLKESDTIETCQ
jgi:hypothetical protein